MDRKLKERSKKRNIVRRVLGGFMALIWISISLGVLHRSLQSPIERHPDSSIEDREWESKSYGYAPHPKSHREPVIQVYAARTWGVKNALAVHTWIATKRQGASAYKVDQIIGWRLRRTGSSLVSDYRVPDQSWWGKEPVLLLDKRGPEVEALIDKVERAIDSYPYNAEYTVWPGPNSNTFTAWIGLEVPELGLDLPSTAIGKDWRPLEQTVGYSPSGTGVQASLYGLAGASLGYEEGLEINVLGLNVELDLFDLAIELPGLGRIGTEPVNSDLYTRIIP